MEAKTFNQKTITELKTSEGSKITGAKQILQEMKIFIRHYTSQNMLVHIGHCRNVRGPGKSMVVIRLFEKLR